LETFILGQDSGKNQMSGLKGLQMEENNVYWDNYLANGLERMNAQITSMNHML